MKSRSAAYVGHGRFWPFPAVVNAAFDLTTAKDLGATATLRKPVTAEELLGSVAALLAQGS